MIDETKGIRPSTREEVIAMIKRHPFITIGVVVVLVVAGVFLAFRSSLATASTTKNDKAAEEKKEEKKLPVEIDPACVPMRARSKHAYPARPRSFQYFPIILRYGRDNISHKGDGIFEGSLFHFFLKRHNLGNWFTSLGDHDPFFAFADVF